MCRIKMSSLVAGIAGKFNGSQFINTRYGLLLQNKCVQRIEPTSSQRQRRNSFQALASSWRSLSSADQEANTAAALSYPLTNQFGDTYYLTGNILRLRSNINLSIAGLPPINVVSDTQPVVPSISNREGGVDVSGSLPLFNFYFDAQYTTGTIANYILKMSFGIVPFSSSSTTPVFFVDIPGNVFVSGNSFTGSVNPTDYNFIYNSGDRVFYRASFIDRSTGVQVLLIQDEAIVF